jgi:twinkle protein
MWEAFITRGSESVTPFPESYGSLNYMMNGGIAQGEITVIGALTSVGKSTMVYNLVYDMMMNTNKKVGVVLLEADMGEITEKLVSLHRGENVSNQAYEDRDMDSLRKSWEDLTATDKLEIYEHHGASDTDDLFNKMRWMIKGSDCEVLILDPLQAAVPSNENGVIDKWMDSCLKLAKETGVSLVIVSHMNKPASSDPHAVSEYHTKGSGSINQIAFNTILLSRDKMAESEYERNLTKVQLVKCRRTGRTGDCGWMYYNAETTRMEQGESPELHEANGIEEF